jgi:hypothetical protein
MMMPECFFVSVPATLLSVVGSAGIGYGGTNAFPGKTIVQDRYLRVLLVILGVIGWINHGCRSFIYWSYKIDVFAIRLCAPFNL